LLPTRLSIFAWQKYCFFSIRQYLKKLFLFAQQKRFAHSATPTQPPTSALAGERNFKKWLFENLKTV